MGILQGALDVIKSIFRIGGFVVPVLRGLREVVPEIDEGFEAVEGAIEQGGMKADDFFDRNLGKIGDLKEFFADLAVAAAAGEDACNRIIVASQVETPDVITVDEGREILENVDAFREAFQAALTKAPALEERLSNMK